MDSLVATIAQILDYVHSQGPEAITQLTALLAALKGGVGVVAFLSGLVATVPAVTEIISQLIALLSSGAGIAEIATVISQLATSLGFSLETVVHLLQMISALLVAF